jgi:hypothetical protein
VRDQGVEAVTVRQFDLDPAVSLVVDMSRVPGYRPTSDVHADWRLALSHVLGLLTTRWLDRQIDGPAAWDEAEPLQPPEF